MQWFLLLIIIGLCGGGYYEYTQLQQQLQTKATTDQAQIDKLTADNKTLEDQNTTLTKTQSDNQASIADLTTKLQGAQTDLASTQKELDADKKIIADAAAKAAAAAAAAAKAAAAAAGPTSNSLGSFTTLDGQSFQNAQLLKIDQDGITFSHSQGITKVNFTLLPPDLQKRFGYDPHQAATQAAAQALYQEQQRKALSGN